MTTNFKKGIEAYGVPVLPILGQNIYVGNVFWVDSGHANAANTPHHGAEKDKPFSSMHYASSRCTANNGDVVLVSPGHIETVIAAAGLSCAVAGVTFLSLGHGATRAQVNFTTAVGADMDIDAANITMHNFLFTGGIDALTGPIDVNAADFRLLNSEWRDVTGQATDVIVADANADRLLVDGWFHNGAAAAGANSGMALVGMDNPVVRNFKMIGNFAVSAIDCRTTAVVDLEIQNGYVWNKNSADVCIKDTITGSTGFIGPNLYLQLTDNAANVTEAVTGATFVVFDNVYVVNLVNEKAMLINWVASTDI